MDKVWIVDDDQSIRWVLQRTLNKGNFNVHCFETASSALTQYKRSNNSDLPDLIFTDVRMPGISGFELVKQIRHIDLNLPIIVMTAYSDLDTTVKAYQQGAFEYLAKPFDIDDAIQIAQNAIKNNKTDEKSLYPYEENWRNAIESKINSAGKVQDRWIGLSDKEWDKELDIIKELKSEEFLDFIKADFGLSNMLKLATRHPKLAVRQLFNLVKGKN